MKKRFLSIALAGALAATALVGCGKSEDPKKEETKAPSGQEESKEMLRVQYTILTSSLNRIRHGRN